MPFRRYSPLFHAPILVAMGGEQVERISMFELNAVPRSASLAG